MTDVIIKLKKENILYDLPVLKNIFETSNDINFIGVSTLNESMFLSRLERIITDFNILYFISEFPNELFLFGEILNIALDIKITIKDRYLEYIPIQIMVISDRCKQVILNVIKKISETYGFMFIYYSFANSILRIQFNQDTRPIEFVIKKEDAAARRLIETELDKLSFTLHKIAFNGLIITIHRSAFESIHGRITEFCHESYNPVDAYKIYLRDYQIKNMKNSLTDLIAHPQVQFYLKNRCKSFAMLSSGTFNSFEHFIESAFS